MIGQPGAERWPSPNTGDRRDGARPDMVVLHYTAMASAEAARDWLCAVRAQVSAHYVLAADGRLWQLVDETARAWHAGAGAWGPVQDVNSRSIGIELANDGAQPFPEPQMAALGTLLDGIAARWDVPAHRIVGHSDTAVGRKIDPGPRFDWRRLAREGRSIWPSAEPGREDPEAFWPAARRFGYRWADGQRDAVLAAFRLRFRPFAQGPLTGDDAAAMADLAKRFACAEA